jgi:hypothetical protein
MRTRLCVLLLLFALNINTANAQFWKKVTDSVGSIANVAVKTVTAPHEAVINAARAATGHASASDIYRPYQNLASATGRSVSITTEAVTDPQRYLFRRAQELASVAGAPGEFLFDVGTFSNQYYTDLANSGLQNIGAILRGQNVVQLASAPLAAAIRAARDRHLADARPLPDDVKEALRPHFSSSILNRAKYSVGKIQITLPHFIGRGAKLFGEDYAVVVDDIIVFNTAPPSYGESKKAAFWWAHELTHVQQYEQLGIEAFAYRYMIGHQRIEDDADANAARVTNDRSQVTKAYLKVGSFDMTSYRDGTNYQKSPEQYVAQCVFPFDPLPITYLVTNFGRIIAVDPMTGNWLHIGFATPPVGRGVSWDYWTPNLRYAVMQNGTIVIPYPVFDPYGRLAGYNYTQVGHVVRLG